MKEIILSGDGQTYMDLAIPWHQPRTSCNPLSVALHAQYNQEGHSWDDLTTEAVLDALPYMAELPSVENFINILKKCRRQGKLELAKSIHVHLCDVGLDTHKILGNHLVPMFVDCGSVNIAEHVFCRLPYQGEHSWTALIQGSTENGNAEAGLRWFDKMQEDCIPPNQHTLVALLKACVLSNCVFRGQEILDQAIKQGWEGQRFIGNTLIDMYAKSGALAEAEVMFNKLWEKDVVSWTVLLAGYAEQGFNTEALRLFNQMQVEGIVPDAVTLLCFLKVCASIGDIERGREIHAQIIQEGFEIDISLGNTLVDMYAKCGLLIEARDVFDEIVDRDVVSWNILIIGYAEYGYGVEALQCLEQMQKEGLPLDHLTYLGSLKACGIVRAIAKGLELHLEITTGRHCNDPVVANTVIDMYAKCGMFAEAQEVLGEMQAPDVISWNALIAGYAEHGLGDAALQCWESMESNGISPNVISFICIFKACGSMSDLAWGLQLHASAAMKGFEGDVTVANTVVDMYAKCGALIEAHVIFDKLSVRDVVSWTALIAGYSDRKHVDKVIDCLSKMQEEYVCPNALTYACSLKVCDNQQALVKGQEIHIEIIKGGLENLTIVGNALVDMYFKCGMETEARKVFERIPVRDVISWTALITGYVELQDGEEALSLLGEMQSDGVYPNAVTYVETVKACSISGDIHPGQELHLRIIHLGLEKDSFVGNALVDMYAKCGKLQEARYIFENLSDQDIVSWNAMIAGYVEHGLDEDALNCYMEMKEKRISPDIITFVCILKACVNVEEIYSGREIHIEIVKRNFEQDPFVGNTMVDLYAKCGLLEEAEKIFNNLPSQDIISWTALTAGYADQGLADEALWLLMQMEHEGVFPDAVAFVSGLKSCGRIGSIEKGEIIHGQIAREGLENDILIGSALVDMYAKCGFLEEAEDVFAELHVQDVVVWNALLAGYVEAGHECEALTLLEKMRTEECSPNDVTLVHGLKACITAGDTEKGKEVHMEIVEKGYESDYFVCNAILYMYSKFGLVEEAGYIFDDVSVEDEVSWHALLSGYADNGLIEDALNCMDQMQLEGLSPGIIAWSATILGFADLGDSKNAYLLFRKMQEQCVLPNTVTFLNMLKVCSRGADPETGKLLHAMLPNIDELDETLGTAVVDMYGKTGCMDDAYLVFVQTATKDLAAWNALITGYARQGESELIFGLFERMIEHSVQPDGITFLHILTACSHGGLVEKGLKYYEAMIHEYGIAPNEKHQNCMIDLLGRAGRLDEAILVLENTQLHSEMAMWSIILAACKKWGNVDLGKQAFERVVNMDDNYGTAFVTMSNIYAESVG